MLELSPQCLTPTAQRLRWGLFGITTAPLISSYFYSQGYRLPIGCPIRYLTGIPCPTCGMTRSFTAIAQGDLVQALNYHLFGPVLFAMFAIAALHLVTELATRRSIQSVYRRWLTNPRWQRAALLIYLGYYVSRLAALVASGQLATTISQSPLGHWLLGFA